MANIFLILASAAHGQESLLSYRERYLDALALAGLVARPSLGYRSFSDSAWEFPLGEHPWMEWFKVSRTRPLGPAHLALYGPEIMASYNSAYPHGSSDGALWQGVGFNTKGSAGMRIEAFGFEATFKPAATWQQNLDFDILPGVNGSPFSYFWKVGNGTIDLVQRFGDASFGGWDWGDSEIRWSMGPFTAGFGTQAVWLGPARNNPIMMSNNAPPFPKADLGLRRVDTPIGHIEARTFWGKLNESEYFDSDPSNDENLLTGLAFYWEPSFLRGLTLGVNRTMLTKWDAMDWTSILSLLWPFMDDTSGTRLGDQRASLTLDYLLPEAGVEFYAEWARNDYSPSWYYWIRYPFHTQAYTLGARKLVEFGASRRIWGVIGLEISNVEVSKDYFFAGPSSFYVHTVIKQGYSNRGQLLGAPVGSGGNGQYLTVDVYFPWGSLSGQLGRINRDNDYVYFLNWPGGGTTQRYNELKFNAELTAGLTLRMNIQRHIEASLGGYYCWNHNPLYNPVGASSTMLYNVYLVTTLSYDL